MTAPAFPARPVPEGPLRFSVIVPLGLHHGQAERALAGWSQGQTYPRELYEVLAVAPPSVPASALSAWQRLLGGNDRLLPCPDEHDMALYTAGARAAGGELFFFTESHCWPERDALDKAQRVFTARPDLGGFSGGSRPSTPNRLSRVEAERYERDADRVLLRHPWCAVLDHAFVVRRECFFGAGGFDLAMGHFAEWALAARLHHMKVAVERVPEALVHHHYPGRVEVWREFTEDFVDGQMRFLDQYASDPAARLLPEVPEWSGRTSWGRAIAGRMLALSWRDWRARRRPGSREGPLPVGDVVWRLARWAPPAVAGARPALFGARLHAWHTGWRLQWAMRFARPPSLRAAMERHWAAVIRRRRLHWVARHSRGCEPETRAVDDRRKGGWEAAGLMALPVTGFHLAEEWQGVPFRWSEPVAMVVLPVGAGDYRLEVEWLPVRPSPDARFYLNERALPQGPLPETDRVALKVRVPPGGPARLAWATSPFRAPGDRRALGLPVRRIRWEREAP